MGGERSLKVILLVMVFLLFPGCATDVSHPVLAPTGKAVACQESLEEMDRAIRNAGVTDASSFPAPGFPYLRANRFLVAVKDHAKTEQGEEQLVQLMRQLYEGSREKEVLNLPESDFQRLQRNSAAPADRREVVGNARACAEAEFLRDKGRPDFYKTLFRTLKAPDEYSSLQRAIGLFPIFSIPVNVVSARVKKKFQAWYNEPLDQLPVEGSLKVYGPRSTAALSASEIPDLLRAASANPLGVPLLDENDQSKLAAFFAPVLIQDVAGIYDRIGRVYRDQGLPDVDPLNPTVYYYFSHGLAHERPMLQVNYVVWYSARTAGRSPRIERGRLDGLTVRVSLDSAGAPFMVDVMNNCGCYHFFSPKRQAVIQVKSRPHGLQPFVPQWLPDVSPTGRLGLRISSGWHQVERLLPVDSFGARLDYDLVPYHVLESLPDKNGNRRSIFNPEGIAVGTARMEPLIFFSMGIPSIGSMRQRGHHAIELTGRAQFDDPLLFERDFILR